jgi:hypothetical protein
MGVCGILATTGSPVLQFLMFGLLCLIGGGVLIALTRRRRTGTAALLVLLVAGATVLQTLPGRSPAEAATTCTSSSSPVRPVVTQTSVDDQLAPGHAPELIAGLTVNQTTATIRVTAITVHIASVTKAAHAAAGPCGPDDYRLLYAVMPVGRTLAPGASTAFSGAFIAFNDRSVDQDACQGATLHLTYTSS